MVNKKGLTKNRLFNFCIQHNRLFLIFVWEKMASKKYSTKIAYFSFLRQKNADVICHFCVQRTGDRFPAIIPKLHLKRWLIPIKSRSNVINILSTKGVIFKAYAAIFVLDQKLPFLIVGTREYAYFWLQFRYCG
jgi:hypothetical protein